MTELGSIDLDDRYALTSSLAPCATGGTLDYSKVTNRPDIPIVHDTDITIQGNNGLTGSGVITLNQTDEETVTLSHADTSTQLSVDNGDGTVIQDIKLDDYGHVTELGSTNLDNRYTPTSSLAPCATGGTLDYSKVTNRPDIPIVHDTDITIQGNNGLTGSGVITLNQTDEETVTLSHADTSTQSSVNNKNGKVIQDIELDDYGHVTELGSIDLDDRYTKTSSLAPCATGGSISGDLVDGGSVDVNRVLLATGDARTRLRLWRSDLYGIGMESSHNFGGLNNQYAMTFSMNGNADRGFWWGTPGYTKSQGAMSLTQDGRLTVAKGMRIGYGQTDGDSPGQTGLEVDGNIKRDYAYTRKQEFTGIAENDELYLGQFTTASPPAKIGVFDTGSSLDSGSEFKMSIFYNKPPVINAIQASGSTVYRFLYYKANQTTYHIWMKPSRAGNYTVFIDALGHFKSILEPSNERTECNSGLYNISTDEGHTKLGVNILQPEYEIDVSGTTRANRFLIDSTTATVSPTYLVGETNNTGYRYRWGNVDNFGSDVGDLVTVGNPNLPEMNIRSDFIRISKDCADQIPASVVNIHSKRTIIGETAVEAADFLGPKYQDNTVYCLNPLRAMGTKSILGYATMPGVRVMIPHFPLTHTFTIPYQTQVRDRLSYIVRYFFKFSVNLIITPIISHISSTAVVNTQYSLSIGSGGRPVGAHKGRIIPFWGSGIMRDTATFEWEILPEDVVNGLRPQMRDLTVTAAISIDNNSMVAIESMEYETVSLEISSM